MTQASPQPHYRQIEQALRERIVDPAAGRPPAIRRRALRRVRRQPDDRPQRHAAAGRGRPGRAASRAGQLRRRTPGAPAGEPADDVHPGDAPGRTRPELAGPDQGRPSRVDRRGRAPRHRGRASRSSTCAGCAWRTVSRSRSRSTVLIGACAEAVMTADLAKGSLHETLGGAGIVLRRGTSTIRRGRRDRGGRPTARGPARRPAPRRAPGHRRRARPTRSRRPSRATRPTATGSSSSSTSKDRTSSAPASPRARRRAPSDERRSRRRRSRGRLVLDDRVAHWPDHDRGRPDRRASTSTTSRRRTARTSRPGFVDVHVHGWGGHDAMGDATALDGMARRLLAAWRHVVPADGGDGAARRRSSRSPTASAPGCRTRRRTGPTRSGSTSRDRSSPPARRGAHDPAAPAARRPTSPAPTLEPLVDGLRLITIAPELPGAPDLIALVPSAAASRSRSATPAATLDDARAGYAAGATATTHLFNAMSGVDHRAPGLAAGGAARRRGRTSSSSPTAIHVHPALWPLITRVKPPDRLLLVSDAVALAGTGDGLGPTRRARGRGRRRPRDARRARPPWPDPCSPSTRPSATSWPPGCRCRPRSPPPAATRWPCSASRTAAGSPSGQRADLVELDADLAVRRVMRAGRWVVAGGQRRRPQRGGIAANVRSMSSSTRTVASVTTSR